MLELKCKCGCTELDFLGEGEYKCPECGETVLSPNGRMQRYLNVHPEATVEDLVEKCAVEEDVAIQYLFPKPNKLSAK